MIEAFRWGLVPPWTSDTAPEIRDIHHRMPVVLQRELWPRRLDPAASVAELRVMLRPCESGDLVAYSVSAVVNSPANDSVQCVLPLADAAPG